mgnify:CR=1 FL=1
MVDEEETMLFLSLACNGGLGACFSSSGREFEQASQVGAHKDLICLDLMLFVVYTMMLHPGPRHIQPHGADRDGAQRPLNTCHQGQVAPRDLPQGPLCGYACAGRVCCRVSWDLVLWGAWSTARSAAPLQTVGLAKVCGLGYCLLPHRATLLSNTWH